MNQENVAGEKKNSSDRNGMNSDVTPHSEVPDSKTSRKIGSKAEGRALENDAETICNKSNNINCERLKKTYIKDNFWWKFIIILAIELAFFIINIYIIQHFKCFENQHNICLWLMLITFIVEYGVLAFTIYQIFKIAEKTCEQNSAKLNKLLDKELQRQDLDYEIENAQKILENRTKEFEVSLIQKKSVAEIEEKQKLADYQRKMEFHKLEMVDSILNQVPDLSKEENCEKVIEMMIKMVEKSKQKE